MDSLFSTIESFDNVAAIAAARSAANFAIAREIGALRSHVRGEERKIRDTEADTPSIDQRNSEDENSRSTEELAGAMGFEQNIPPMRLAEGYFKTYKWAADLISTRSSSMWDEPLGFDAMLTFMTEKSQTLDAELLKQLAAVVKADEASIRKLAELQDRQDREKLKEIAPTLKSLHAALESENDNAPGLPTLSVIQTHQLAVRVTQGLRKSVDAALVRILRTKKISEMGDIPLLTASAGILTKWVMDFERRHADTLREALDSGITLQTL
jgi:hypothetical protein